MKKQVVLLSLVLLACTVLSQAQEDKTAGDENGFHAEAAYKQEHKQLAQQEAKPGSPSAAARREAVRRALAWLVKALEDPDWNKNLGGNNNADSQRYIAVMLTAWLLELNADLPEFDKARVAIRSRADRLLKGPPAPIFGSWRNGVAGYYAFERSLRDGQPHPALDRTAREIVADQNAEGGWSHQKFSLVPTFYPSTVNAVSNLALLSLAAAERMKVQFSNTEQFKKAVADGLQLLRDVQGPTGGMPYGGRYYRNGGEAGRTAGMLLALAAWRQTDNDMFRRAANYALNNMEMIPQGHACTSMHVALGSLACYILSDDAFRQYDAKILDQVRKLQLEDGTFKKGLGVSFPNTGKGNELFDKAYPTAFFALALSADRTEVARHLRLSPPFPLPPVAKAINPGKAPAASWQVDLDDVVDVDADAQTIVALQGNGTMSFLAADSGKPLAKIALPVKGKEVQNLVIRGDKAFVQTRGQLSCYDVKKEMVLWQVEVGKGRVKWKLDGDHVIVFAFGPPANATVAAGGELMKIAIATGKVERRFKAGPVVINFDLQPLGGDRCAFCSQSQFNVYDDKGQLTWKAPNKADKGLIPASVATLAAAADQLYSGGSDAKVTCREQATGKVLWQLQLADSVHKVYGVTAKPEQVIAVGQQGLVYGIKDGKINWQRNIARGIEKDGRLVHRMAGANLVVRQPWHGIVVIDAADGQIKHEWPLPATVWAATERQLITWSDGQVKTFSLN